MFTINAINACGRFIYRFCGCQIQSVLTMPAANVIWLIIFILENLFEIP